MGEETKLSKRAVAAFLTCTVMLLIAAAPLVGAETHHVIKGAQGPRASAVSWTMTPAAVGVWHGHVVNSGLNWITVDVFDVTAGSSSVMHQRIRFGAYPSDTLDTNSAMMAKGHVYNITVTPNGPRGSSCTVEDVFDIPPPPPVAVFDFTVSAMTVWVDGSFSYDPSGTVLEWAWDWGDGTTTGPSPIPTAEHTYGAYGAYVVELTVLSSTGMTASASHMVPIPWPILITFTCTVMGMSVMVDASGNVMDPPIVSYDWNWGDGSMGTGVVAVHTYLVSGTYDITLTLTDSFGQTYSTTRTVPVGGGQPPVMAFAYTISGFSVIVNASTLSGDVGIVSYAWDWGDGINGTGMVASHAYSGAGPYVITLTVTDTNGHTSSVKQSVPSEPGVPSVPAFTATVAPNRYTVTADASSSAGAGLSYFWDWGDQWTSTGVIRTHSYAYSGEFTITLTVTDQLGQSATESKKVIVTNTQIPPMPFILYGTTYASDGVTPLPDCAISVTVVRSGETLIGPASDSSGMYSCDLSNYIISGDTVLVQAKGPSGQRGSSSGVISFDTPYLGVDVTLDVVENQAPPSFAVIVSQMKIAFDASASTDSKGIVSYAWEFGDGTTGTGVTTSHDYSMPPFTFNVTLTGTNLNGVKGTVTHMIGLPSLNIPPFAGFAWNVTGLNATFNGLSSVDPDGTIVLYSWDFGDGSAGSGPTISHEYPLSGIYQVKLTVTDNLGATGSQDHTVMVASGMPLILLSDDFSGGVITDWTLDTTGGQISLDTSTGMAAAPSMKLYKQQAAGSTRAVHNFTDVMTGHVVAEANLKVDAVATNQWKWTYFNLYDASGSVQTYFGFIDGQMRYYTTSGWQNVGVPYLADTWYNIKLDVEIVAGTYDIYVDGVLMKTGAPLWGMGPHSVNSVGFQAGTYNDLYGMTMWVDDVKVSWSP